ncbi:MAG TPA: DoxX family membrane protein, partial [Leptospiraceae bacterium]|nr:DoxX family membrane protein [Leptospiraceae bacterium]
MKRELLESIVLKSAGILLFVLGLDKLQPFLPHPEAAEPAAVFKKAMFDTWYFLKLVGLTEISVGTMFISGYFIRLGLVILAPLSINFLFYHLFLDLMNIPAAVFILLFNIYFAWKYK